MYHHERRENDWICSLCSALNFADRQSCYRCQQDRSYGGLGTRGPNRQPGNSDTGRGGSNSNQGSWRESSGGDSSRNHVQGGGYGGHSYRVGNQGYRGGNQGYRGGGQEYPGGGRGYRGGGQEYPGGGQGYPGGGQGYRDGGQGYPGGGHQGGSSRGMWNRTGNNRNSFVPSAPIGNDISEIVNLIKVLHQKCKSPKDVTAAIDRSMNVWLSAWIECACLNISQLGDLIGSFAIVSPSYVFPSPPSITHCQAAVKRYLEADKVCDDSLPSVEIVMRLVKRLLLVKWEGSKETVRDEIRTILSEANKALNISRPEHRTMQNEIITILDEIEKPWIILMKLTTKSKENKKSESEKAANFSEWQKPTVKWLANPKQFQPSCLPKMKVPQDQSQGVYPDKKVYFDTVHRLWIGLTFYDGNSTLNPKCRHKTNTKECGEVLWFLKDKAGNLRCRFPGCISTVVMACKRPHHNQGLCDRCYRLTKGSLMGPPTQHASTHIYDCQVSKIDCEGYIYMVNLKSRRPPQINIHWRSTKRLVRNNLVALVKLKTRESKLLESDPIIWAEVDNHDQARDEYMRRVEGKIKVSLSSICDVSISDQIQCGDHIAIIDCMTFVPEHIPVLKALDVQKLAPLPFQEGSLLNLNNVMRSIEDDRDYLSSDDDSSSDDDYSSDEDIIITPRVKKDKYDIFNAFKLVDNMVEQSQLSPIVQIRRDPAKSSLLKTSLAELASDATLDREQLESFIKSLTHPVHLTQGPPGTGKSYLGVVLVRALLVIREIWIEVCPTVGFAPILVLSYKNHAIDEFLCDLIEKEKSGYKEHLSMIRIGGSNDEPRLNWYSEKNQTSYRYETGEAKRNLQTLHQHRMEQIQQQNKLSPLVIFESIFFNTEDPNFKTLSEVATVYLSNLIVRVANIKKYFEEEDGDENVTDLATLWRDNFPKGMEDLILQTSDIESLCIGVKHYNIKQPAEIIYKWIMGGVPRAQCSSRDCLNIVPMAIFEFCIYHLCNCTIPVQCYRPRKLDRFLCEEHACQEAGCGDIKLPSPQIYCIEHACTVCVSKNLVAQLGTDMAPRNTCEAHPLCNSEVADGYCLNLALPNLSFCEEHKSAICSATTSKGHACKEYVMSRGNIYCKNHQVIITIPKKEVISQMFNISKCKGITKKNKPCKSKPLDRYEYCKDHVLKYKAKPIASAEKEDEVKSVLEIRSIEVAKSAEDNIDTTTTKEATINGEPDSFSSDKTMDWKSTEQLGSEAISAVNEEDEEESDQLQHISEVYMVDEPLPDESDEAVNEEEEEESDQLRHIREVYMADDQPDELLKEVEDGTVNQDEKEEEEEELDEYKTDMVASNQWTWEMSLEQRWDQCKLLEKTYLSLMHKINQQRNREIEVARQEYHNAKIRAKSLVYEGKAVIGGTIVGCIARLEAIRNSKPFAILVEEASEVLEPLLFSCLSESTCKLEMIGDHLQLQPSIMSKIEFERINSINISMFERLINAPDNYSVPSTSLATQRRMRKNICDLTRYYYKEIVEIADHEICNTKKIADGLNMNIISVNKLKRCLGEGREVPGVLPHVFFWTHKGAQTKAHVGLSRINEVEADMAVGLTKYLVECGVPKPSIAILTPYKGQLMLMRKDLVKMRYVDKFRPEESVIVSTVDRFQGDEADIVIISLVIDAKSHTPFVKKVNRMIVLLSRARIGMFILGNVGYFEEKPDPSISHWSSTLEKLRKPAEQDTYETSLREDIDDLTFSGSRLGDKLPICCPIHRYNSLEAGSVQQLKLNFCDEECLKKLPCSHACGIPCHFETPGDHNTACSVLITPPPCDQHRDDVTCFDVFQNVKGYQHFYTVDDALTKYRCPKKVDVQLPCTHTLQMTCAEESDIASNVTKYPECKQLALAPYSYPVCGHELKVLCCVWYEYKKDPSKVKVCKEKVMYTPTCAHQVQMDCYLKLKIDSQQQEFHCTKMMDIILPRCGHKQNVSCDKAQTIAQWKGNACEPDIVREGQSYGPIDHTCKQEIRYVRVCGHETTMPCQMAFQQAPIIVNCKVNMKVTNPECGHPAVVACHINKQLLTSPTTKPPVTEIREGHSAIMFGNPILHLNCETQVSLQRKCGHIETLKCCQARDEHVQPCKAVITVINPICGHEIKLPCHKQSEFFNWNPWPNGVTYKEILYDNVLKESFPPPSMLPLELEGFVKPCSIKIHVLRSCEHMYEKKCGTAFFDLNTKVTTKCMETIDAAKLNCGHEATMECNVYTVYKQNPKSYQCHKDVLLQCWNFNVCKNVVKSKCNLIGTPVPCGNIANWTCSAGHVTQNLPLCEKGIPTDCPHCIVNNVEKEVKTPSELKTTLPKHLLKCKQEKVFTQIKLQVFNHNKSILLNRYIEWLKICTLSFRPLYTPKLIPCFHYEEFKMKLNTLSSCQVYEWTSKNINQIIIKAKRNNGEIQLYVGIAFCARVNANPKDKPGKKKKKDETLYKYSTKVQAWAKEKINLGFDSVQVNVNLMDELYLFAPYTAICTHKVTVKVSELEDILKNNTLKSHVFKQEFIKYVLPENRSSLLAQVPTESLHHKDERLAKVQLNWNGEDLGAFEQHIQKELISKLGFCSIMSGSDSASLFGGLNYLKQMSKELKVVEIPLLLALEQIKLDDFEAASAAYKDYLRMVKKTKSKNHPLAILAEARFYHKNKKNEEEINLLKLFAKLYPHAVDNWFDEGEDELLEGKGESESVRTEEDVLNEIRDRWQMLKDDENVQSEAMDKLIELTGLKKVKNFAIDLFKSAIKFNQMDESFRKANPKTLNFCFLGNAGSGKTTVARLLAEILYDSKMRVTDNFMETSAQKLKDDGSEKFRALADSAKDGTLFIDEAYDLDPKGDSKGKPIVTELLTISENCRDNLSIILAGYEDDMEEKLFSHNEGIKSRFQMVHFEDFDEEDLKAIWDHEVKTRMFTCADVVGTIVAKRLAKLSGKKGFGNARAVRNEVEKATGIAMAREDFDREKKELIARDVMGELPTNNPKLKAVLNEFDDKVGWKSIKDSVQQLIKTCEKNYELQLLGMKTSPVMLNRLFLGNPGTGKTTCGKLYGRLLKQLNFLSVGDVLVKAASDFKGAHVGDSESKTNAILSQARGKVLIIDEAYSLDDNLYGKQVLDVIVEKVQNSENDDIAVLLLGYEKQMREMLRNQNPGLARRFAMDYAFKFNDYTENELFVILQGVCKRENIKLTSEVAELIMKQLEKQRSQANFGNAGAIDNIVRSALSKASIRPLSADKMIRLIPSDVSSDDMQGSTADPLLPLKKLFKMEKIEQQIVEIKNTFQVAEAEGSKDKPVLGHFVFRGSPGTGKTTVARVMAEILYSLGLIARKHVEQTSGLEMTGEHVGHTKKRVQEKLDAARGGVLFIDEAYELGKGSFGEEAITTLVAAMTDPEYRLVIIIAGYPKDMEQMLARNIGLKSRFKRFMDFIDWDSDDCIKFLKQKATNDNYILHEDAIAELKQGIDKLCKFRGWGNARDAIAVWDALIERRANRVVNSPETKKSITLSDAETAISEMIKDRTPKVSEENILEQLSLECQNQLKQMEKTDKLEPPPMQKQNLSEKVSEEKPREDPPKDEKVLVEVERDQGVTDEIWQQLLLDKLLAKKEEDDRLEELENERRLQEEKERLLEELRKRLAEEQEEEKRLQQELRLKQQEDLELKRREDEENRRREKKRSAAAIQEKLRRIGNCPAGFKWTKQRGGWRCAGGTHFVNNKELNDNYTY